MSSMVAIEFSYSRVRFRGFRAQLGQTRAKKVYRVMVNSPCVGDRYPPGPSEG
jgi:hypothetical protein